MGADVVVDEYLATVLDGLGAVSYRHEGDRWIEKGEWERYESFVVAVEEIAVA